MATKLMRQVHKAGVTYGCDDCYYYANHRCKLWEVKVPKPEDSHCENHTIMVKVEV